MYLKKLEELQNTKQNILESDTKSNEDTSFMERAYNKEPIQLKKKEIENNTDKQVQLNSQNNNKVKPKPQNVKKNIQIIKKKESSY